MNLLDLLAESHTDWLKMARSLGGKHNKVLPLEMAEDIVQEMYIRLNKYVGKPERIMYNETEINSMFIFTTLRNIYFNYYNQQSKLVLIPPNELYLIDEECIQPDKESLLERMRFENRVINEINTWTHYESKLFKIIFLDNISMRELSRDSGISLSSIFNSIKNGKEKLRMKFGDEFEIIKYNQKEM